MAEITSQICKQSTKGEDGNLAAKNAETAEQPELNSSMVEMGSFRSRH